MAEINDYHEKILYLATAFRSEFSEKEFALENKQEKFNIQKTTQQPHLDSAKIIGHHNGSTREGTEISKESLEEELGKWKQAFSKLRPPLNFSKRKHLQSGFKFTNKSCEEILQIVGSYSENLESETRWKGHWEMEEEANESVHHHLWSIDDAEFPDNAEGEEFPYEIGESSETPIPRNLSQF